MVNRLIDNTTVNAHLLSKWAEGKLILLRYFIRRKFSEALKWSATEKPQT